jgi:hypothetical protein
LIASSAVNLYFGLKTNSFFKKSKASSEAFGKNEWKLFFFVTLILDKILAAKLDSILSKSSYDGLPVSSRILSI